MGTAAEWVHVAFMSIFWTGAMLLLESSRRKGESNLAPLALTTLTFSLGGLLFGLLTTFGRRAFHLPMIFLTLALVIAAWTCGRLRTGMVRSCSAK